MSAVEKPKSVLSNNTSKLVYEFLRSTASLFWFSDVAIWPLEDEVKIQPSKWIGIYLSKKRLRV